MKTRVLSIFLILLLCLTAGCGKASQNTEKPDGFSFSESQTEEAAGKDTSQAEQTAPAQPPEAQSAQTADEETEGSTESERRPVPEHPVSGTTPPQTSDPQQKKDESERRSETTASPAPSETEQPIPPATEEPKPSEPPQPTQPSTEPPTEPSFDIGYPPIRLGSENRRRYSCQSAVHGLHRELYDHHGQLQGSQDRV
jgi:PREDICTED: similar to thrombospondin type 1 repeat containing protein